MLTCRCVPSPTLSAQSVAAQHAQRLSVAYNNLAGILKLTGRLGECIQCYEHVVYLQVRGLAGLLCQAVLGIACAARCTCVVALCCSCVLTRPYVCATSRGLVQPQSPEAYANLASAFKDSGRHDEAINTYRQVSTGQQLAAIGRAAAPHSCCVTLLVTPNAQLPISCPLLFLQALALRADFPEAFANLVHSLQCVCEWADRPALFKRWAAVGSGQGCSAVLQCNAAEWAAPGAALKVCACCSLPLHPFAQPTSLPALAGWRVRCGATLPRGACPRCSPSTPWPTPSRLTWHWPSAGSTHPSASAWHSAWACRAWRTRPRCSWRLGSA